MMRLLIFVFFVVASVVPAAKSHVALTWPPAANVPLDFLDNARTTPPCGGIPASYFMNKTSPQYTLVREAPLLVTWHLGYPHKGGYRLELINPSSGQVKSYLAGSANSFVGAENPLSTEFQVIEISAGVNCTDTDPCALRMVRQALEWGPDYQFMSCANVRVIDGLLGVAQCEQNAFLDFLTGVCVCPAGFWGAQCQYKDDCALDAENSFSSDCNNEGICSNYPPGRTTYSSRNRCFCRPGSYGKNCEIKSSILSIPTDKSLYKKISPASDFTIYYRRRKFILSDDLEVIVESKGTNWVGIGFKPLTLTEGCRKFPYHRGGDAEPEPEPEPVAEPGTAGAGLHAMDCADMVIGMATTEGVIIEDAYTRDRSTPLPDRWYGGSNSLTAAAGQLKDGVVSIVFRKPVTVEDTDGPTDHSIVDGPMRVIWARGQEKGSYIHRPASGYEQLCKGGAGTCPDFYPPTELKYHGTSSNQRGVFIANLLGDEPAPEPTKEPVPEPTKEPAPEPTKEPAPEPTKEPAPEPTKEPAPEPTKEPAPEPTKEPAPEPTKEPAPEPTNEPAPEPTKEPAPEPTNEPAPEPTKEPAPEPTNEPAPEPTKEPEPEPTAEPGKVEKDSAEDLKVLSTYDRYYHDCDGGNLPDGYKYKARSDAQCARSCNKNFRCIGFSFIHSRKECYLKKKSCLKRTALVKVDYEIQFYLKRPIARRPGGMAGANTLRSYNRRAAMQCSEKQFLLAPNTVESADDCARQCNNYKFCRGFNIGQASSLLKTCQLFSSSTHKRCRKIPAADYEMYVKGVGSGVIINDYQLLPGYCTLHAEMNLLTLPSATVDDCGMKCKEMKECASFTMIPISESRSSCILRRIPCKYHVVPSTVYSTYNRLDIQAIPKDKAGLPRWPKISGFNDYKGFCAFGSSNAQSFVGMSYEVTVEKCAEKCTAAAANNNNCRSFNFMYGAVQNTCTLYSDQCGLYFKVKSFYYRTYDRITG